MAINKGTVIAHTEVCNNKTAAIKREKQLIAP
jgi:hypothetical protein